MTLTHNCLAATDAFALPALRVGNFILKSRLVVGTGKYPDYDTMQHALHASGCDVVTVAVRRERLVDAQGRSLLDHLDLAVNGKPRDFARDGIGCKWP